MGAERRGLLLYLALLGCVAGTLGSCATEQAAPPQSSAARPPPPPPENVVRSRPAPRPTRKPAPPAESSVSASSAQSVAITAPTALLPSEPPTAAAPASSDQSGPRPPETAELIGLDQAAATRLFGPAAERSDEPPATVWRYKTASCELDLFFYLDLRSGQMRTLHYALKGEGADTKRRQDCLRSLVAARGG